ncbi:nicotinamidase/pyrazinamidase [Lachnospiraceae bacterium PF1-21]|uniref:Cysteine hydrolase n=1 Tax=Ohessyouella blattaphilus TaxID=2949333 RepID=A0ABT1EH16_9FIRM|nr:isochorismatase family cysteine hydrolase [Ohessyouella blattaphilus]MCP1109062.1 cysteine hydrolase [Ohessyouella blattaphilus]MCR8562456.1 cysteine hydrolase [Ohessyouella blattaphilus]MDL2250630.1 cysteine hydrolase [Lachnospiraceae bacterium OttesenSCG-928-J05]
MDVLVVIDMQNDFIDGSLGTKEAQAILPNVEEKIKNFKGTVLFTRDTHEKTYLDSREGMSLPVCHCLKGTKGWEINSRLKEYVKEEPIDKPTFGSRFLAEKLVEMNEAEKIESVTLIGVCTDICVISNALVIRSFLPELPITVDASCCAGVSKCSHENALEAMKMCQIEIEGL